MRKSPDDGTRARTISRSLSLYADRVRAGNYVYPCHDSSDDPRIDANDCAIAFEMRVRKVSYCSGTLYLIVTLYPKVISENFTSYVISDWFLQGESTCLNFGNIMRSILIKRLAERKGITENLICSWSIIYSILCDLIYVPLFLSIYY